MMLRLCKNKFFGSAFNINTAAMMILTGLMVPVSVATNLSLLTSLDLSNNQLQAVPTSELAGLTSLRRLELSGNLFTSLAPHSFRELHSLQQLYLTNCSHLR